MKKTLTSIITLLAGIALFASASSAQTVYFQRQPQTGSGALCSVPVSGPESSLTDIVSGINHPNHGGIQLIGNQGFFYSDVAGDLILIGTKKGQTQVVVTAAAGLNSPRAIAYDQTGGFLYIADFRDGSTARIVRVNLTGDLPANSVEPVVEDTSGLTPFISDLKFNSSDRMLYWTATGNMYRIAPDSESLPAATAQQISTQGGLFLTFFDFNGDSTQSIYVVDGSAQKGIFIANVPPPGGGGSVPVNETVVFDISGDPDTFIQGVAVEKKGRSMCYSAFNNNSTESYIRCGDTLTTPVSDYTEIVKSALSTGGFTPSSMDIETPLQIVRPGTKPDPATATVNIAGKKPSATIILQPFAGADTKKNTQGAVQAALDYLSAAAKKRAKAKIGFQYQVEIRRVSDASGKPFKKKQQDLQKKLTKRNELTVKNLKPNSVYSVKYRVEITSKSGKNPPKVVKRTPFSDNSRFTVAGPQG